MKGLAEAQEARPRDLSSLRTGIFAAGMLSATPVVRRGMRALAPLRNLSGFGMTETWLGVSLSSLDDDEVHRSEASGWPGLGYELRIVDDGSGDVLGAGRAGELQVHGWRGDDRSTTGSRPRPRPPSPRMAGSAPAMRRCGCADGCLRFLGRYKDMLKVGGENVDPMETEALLLEHPAVQQVAVVGLPDARLGEVPVAYVECRAGRHARHRRGDRPLPRQDRELQAAAPRGVRRRLSR